MVIVIQIGNLAVERRHVVASAIQRNVQVHVVTRIIIKVIPNGDDVFNRATIRHVNVNQIVVAGNPLAAAEVNVYSIGVVIVAIGLRLILTLALILALTLILILALTLVLTLTLFIVNAGFLALFLALFLAVFIIDAVVVRLILLIQVGVDFSFFDCNVRFDINVGLFDIHFADGSYIIVRLLASIHFNIPLFKRPAVIHLQNGYLRG